MQPATELGNLLYTASGDTGSGLPDLRLRARSLFPSPGTAARPLRPPGLVSTSPL